MKRNKEAEQEDPQARENLSRRNFVKKAAAGLGAAAAVAGMESLPGAAAEGTQVPKHWDHEADIVIIGAGATGLCAAVEAIENGCSVIAVDANTDVGGHAIVSGGNIALGGGTTRQEKYGVKDSPDLLFADLTDWSIVEPNGFPDYRYNDKEIIRAFADNSAATCEWLMKHGVIFVEKTPDNAGAHATGNSAPRENHCAPMQWPQMQTGVVIAPEKQATTSAGIGFVRPMEASARKLGAQILLEHRMTSIVRETQSSGRVLGITATNKGQAVNVRARKGVIIGTGGHSSNVNFRRIFDPRLTEEYQTMGEAYSTRDASGELAAMALGASLWGAYNQTGEFGEALSKAGRIGSREGYVNLGWMPASPVFSRAGATGLLVRDWQDVILVNQAGLRFYDETKGQYPTANNYGAIKPYIPGSYLNAANIKYEATNFLNGALAGTGEAVNGGGPIWAIFDADAVKREGWNTAPPDVDAAGGLFFSGNTIAELARNIVNRFQRKPVPPAGLEDTVAKYNSYVDAGKDPDFGKASPKYKIQTPPFYAAWSTPVVHDSRVGLRINAKCEVIDLNGNVIPGLYCGGESAGGFSLHGIARCSVQGRIAAREAAKRV